MAPLTAPVVGIASGHDGSGYWLVDSQGHVSPHSVAVASYGSLAGDVLNAPIVHIVATSNGKGYWLVAADGGIFAFGDAGFFGSMGGKTLNAPVVDLAPTPDEPGLLAGRRRRRGLRLRRRRVPGLDGWRPPQQAGGRDGRLARTGGYRLVASDGGIFAFGAPFYGSTGDLSLTQPVNGMAVTADGGGLLAGGRRRRRLRLRRRRLPRLGGGHPRQPPRSRAWPPTPTTGGYWLVGQTGGVYAFGAPFYGAA